MLHELTLRRDYETVSFSPENLTGEKGKGGMSVDGSASYAARDLGQGWKVNPYVVIEGGDTFELARASFEGMIKHMWCTIAHKYDRNLILRIYWDGSERPSVEVPLTDLFESASQSTYRQLSSIPVCVNPGRGFECRWEMPFRKGFRMTLENISPEKAVIYYQVDCEKRSVSEDAMYFHAQFRRVNPLPYKEVYTILDNVHGRGKYVGTYMFWGVHANRWWGEGEIKFYLDGDTDFPTVCGTGTEDYFCGGFDFDPVVGRDPARRPDEKNYYQEYTTPYAGMYKIEDMDDCYRSQLRFNMYRWHVTDPVYFKKDIRVTIQALGWRSDGRYLPLQDDISSVAYWYQTDVCNTFPELPDRDYLEII